MKLVRCDICGNEFRDTSPYIRLIVHDTILHAIGKVPDEEWDLCEQCGNEILAAVRVRVRTDTVVIRTNK